MAAIDNLIPHIYHEKQEPGEMLCAQHALNSLLQGPYFSAPDLSEIARQLDEDERRELNAEEHAATSTNMDDTGFFSVQVLQKALSEGFGLSLVPWEAEELRPYHDHPHTQLGFILNQSQHWYSLRRFGSVPRPSDPEVDPPGGHWFNLNSFNKEPERISKLYLGMFLQQAKQEGYSIFAVVQRDPNEELALPRVEVDAHFASIPEALGGFSYSNTYSFSRQTSSRPQVEEFEDEDMELQAALQASLSGGQYGEYIPQRFGSTSAPFEQPSRTASGVPIRRDYEVVEPDDDDEDAPMRVDADPEPLDPVAASMARQRAIMDRMRRVQELALQEQYQGEVAHINAIPRRQEPARAEEDEDEMLRRAIAESEAMAQAQAQGSGSGADSGATSRDEPVPPAPPAAAPTWHQHRVYDDEDQELQAALRASLETVPEGFRVPSPPPVAKPPSPPVGAVSRPSPPADAPPSLERQQSESSNIDTESEADSTAEQPEQLSVEEMRKRRLARFGG